MKYPPLNELLEGKKSPYETFHKRTKITKLAPLLQLSKKWSDPSKWEKIYHKAYARFPEVPLPTAHPLKAAFGTVLKKRMSVREFSKKTVSLKTLSTLLHYSAGQNGEKTNSQNGLRFYPSAGARFPLEVYVLPSNVESLEMGLYHYYIKNHSLEKLSHLKSANYLHYFNQEWIEQASALIFITAVFKRTTSKYGNRGYRHVLMEAGHMGQNIYLCSSALSLKCCAIGGYIDNKVNALLDIDETEESIVYVFAIG